MPFDASLLVAIIGLFIAAAVWAKTRRVGPVAGVLVGAFLVMAIADPSILQKGGQAVGDAITWAFDQFNF